MKQLLVRTEEVNDKVSDLSSRVSDLLNIQSVEHVLGPVIVYELEQLDLLLMDYLEGIYNE